MELGADGRFAFADAAPGRYAITVSHPDRGPLHRRTVEVEVPAEGDPPEVEVRLDGLGVLLVEVAAPDGRPVPGARAACLGPAGPVPLSRLSTGARGAEFGAQVDPGDYRVSVTAPGRLTQERLVTVGAGDEKRLKVVLP
jgi:hypothetical protein